MKLPFATAYIRFLGLKAPVKFRIIKGSRKPFDAEYEPIYSDDAENVIEYHSIVICRQNVGRAFRTLVAHELIHAAQEEKGLLEFHGPFFQRKARAMGKMFGLKEIFINGVDV